jgi:hypothetical protein
MHTICLPVTGCYLADGSYLARISTPTALRFAAERLQREQNLWGTSLRHLVIALSQPYKFTPTVCPSTASSAWLTAQQQGRTSELVLGEGETFGETMPQNKSNFLSDHMGTVRNGNR